MKCEKHTWEFFGNRVFKKITIGLRGSRCEISIRAYYVCAACGKEQKRTPNPNHPMPKIL